MKETGEKPLEPIDKSTAGRRETLYLTNNRTFQQNNIPEEGLSRKELRKQKKRKLVKISKHKPPFCQRYPLILLHFNNGELEKIVKSKVRCKSWSCPVCAPINAIQAYFKIRRTAILNGLQYFLTLTLDPSTIPEKYLKNSNRTHKYITYLYNRFANKIRRQLKGTDKIFKYIWVIEFQKTGNAHLHILMNLRLDIDFVRKEWVRIGGGRMMKVEKVKDIERVCSYVSSYITKGLKAMYENNYGFLQWERRYSISHSCITIKSSSQNILDNSDLYQQYKSIINQSIVNSSDTIILKKP